MRIWAKVMNGDKIVRDTLYDIVSIATPQGFRHALQDISYQLDIATPISLPTHQKHFDKFNRVKYIPRDFIEEVDFSSVVLELILDKK